MKVLHITTVPMSLRFLHASITYLRPRGFSFSVISSPGTELDEFGRRHSIPAVPVPMQRAIVPLRDLRAVWRIIGVLRNIRPHIVHAHTPKGGLLGMMAAAIVRSPVRIYHLRGLPLMGASGAKRMLLRVTERVSCALATRVICVSKSIRTVVIEERLCPAHKIVVLARGSGQGVDAAQRFNPSNLPCDTRRKVRSSLGIPHDVEVIGFVGRLVKDKGIVDLERSWRILRSENPQWRLLLVGPWEVQDPVPSQVRSRLEADPRVHIIGMTNETPEVYAAVDVVVLPTYREGFPNVPLEAAAMGLPVVATNIPGCIDAVVHDVTGTLVPVGDADAIATALSCYLNDPTLREKHGKAGRLRALADFNPDAISAALGEQYSSLAYSKVLKRRSRKAV